VPRAGGDLGDSTAISRFNRSVVQSGRMVGFARVR